MRADRVDSQSAGLADGYATTPVVVNGVVYTQDLESNVMAIRLATGKVLWTHNYNSPNGGPDGVNVVGGTVYAATNHAAVALSAATGRQLWSRTLIGNDREGIDMAPGYNNGTVYVSTVPVNPTVGEYLGGAKSTLWALNARTGAPEWSWDEVQNLWGKPGLNSGGGLWDPPSFDSPGQHLHRCGQPRPDRPGPVAPRLSVGDQPAGPGPVHRLGRQAEPAGQAAVVLPAHPARPLRLGPAELAGAHHRPRAAGGHRRRQGRHPDRAQRADRQAALEAPGRRAHRARQRRAAHRARHAHLAHPAAGEVLPRARRVRRHRVPAGHQRLGHLRRRQQPPRAHSRHGVAESGKAFAASIPKATGEMVAVNQDTGTIEWDDKLPSSPYGAATVTNNVVFTTTYHGDLYAFNAATGAILLKTPLSAGSNAPVTIDGDYVIAGAGVGHHQSQRPLIIAYKLGATGKLPDTVRS